MTSPVLHALGLIAIPAATLCIGDRLLRASVDIDYLTVRLSALKEEDRKPLYMRLAGYDAAAAERHWQGLDDTRKRIELRLLQLDLLFPLLYGAAFAFALRAAWSLAGSPFHPVWWCLPVATAMAADWTENTILLSQLRLRWQNQPLRPFLMNIASAATRLKFLSICVALVLLVGLLALPIFENG